ncbi:MAG TPA: hypothetical protein VMT45_11760 [Thermoanaerobaculaceae bacterium]|nr:hypothetical protein [Thermoanaerobaculaceae bacterium]
MRATTFLALTLLSTAALAQKPWETKIDLPVPIPIELPAVPPTNPFAAAVVTPPSALSTPLREKFIDKFTVLATAYVNSDGACSRAVFTRMPWPGIETDLRQALAELTFTPARAGGTPVPVWLPVAIDFKGRINKGQMTKLQALTPNPATPPEPEVAATPTPDARDLGLPATPLARVEQLANLKRPPRFSIDGRAWTQPIRLLAEIGADGRCQRVVFLACPEGLRSWLLASMAAWTFRPASAASGPVAAWAMLEGDVELQVADLDSEALRVIRAAS